MKGRKRGHARVEISPARIETRLSETRANEKLIQRASLLCRPHSDLNKELQRRTDATKGPATREGKGREGLRNRS